MLPIATTTPTSHVVMSTACHKQDELVRMRFFTSEILA